MPFRVAHPNKSGKPAMSAVAWRMLLTIDAGRFFRASVVTRVACPRYWIDGSLDRAVKFSNPYPFVADGHSLASLFKHPVFSDARACSAISPGLPIRLSENRIPISMRRHQLILPCADAACGKAFYKDRRTADQHRIVLNFWNQATGESRKGYRLAVYRCKRCGGFHIGRKRIDTSGVCDDPRNPRDSIKQG